MPSVALKRSPQCWWQEKRIRQVFYLTAAEEHRATTERVLGFYADSCPSAFSIKESIEISSELEFTPAQKSSE